MVEYSVLDDLFMALADSTRRSILEQVARAELSISEIAVKYNLTFAAVSKHIKVMERANLITKRRRGKEQLVTIVPTTLNLARDHIECYSALWADRFGNVDELLQGS